jgi:BirA family biotin operon repressor/biotin-[acetyl-CoA-carboxylase] ligase
MRPLREPGGTPGILELSCAASTNSFLADALRQGQAIAGVYTMNQTEGRGRHGRSWVGHPGETLAFSIVCVDPEDTVSFTWIPLLAGAALCEVLQGFVNERIAVKWPNDVFAGGKKLAGILVEAIPGVGIIVGVGVNLHSRGDTLPHPQATSLTLLGGQVRDPKREVIVPFLEQLEQHFSDVSTVSEEDKVARYTQLVGNYLDTLGRGVRVSLPGGRIEQGVAVGLARDGALLVRRDGDSHTTPIHAGDIFQIERS